MSDNIMELDFTGVESYSLIPVGVHNVKVSGAEFKKAQTGSQQLEINFTNNEGASRKAWFSLLPQALWKLKQVLEDLGIPCEGRVKINTKTIVGKTCQITVEDDANDPSRQIVTKVSKLTATAPQPNFTQSVQAAPTQPARVPQNGNNASPSPMMSSPFNAPAQTELIAPAPIQAPVQEQVVTSAQPSPAPQGNLPPWMQNTAPNAQPSGNLPPWMKQ